MNFEAKNKGPKACTTCAKAKSRCIPGPAGSDKCERCHRLSKPCTSQTPAPPRAKKEPRPTKVAELEKRLNELTSQLHSAQNASEAAAGRGVAGQGSSPSSAGKAAPAAPTTPAASRVKKTRSYRFDHLFPPPTDEEEEGREDGEEDGNDDHVGGQGPSPGTEAESDEVSPESFDSSTVTGASAASAEAPLLTEVPWPSGPEADGLLRRFREELEPLYPFVMTPPGLDAARLALKHPFLFKGVMVSAYHDDAYRQLRLGDRLLDEMTRAAFTQPHKGLDVLQALQLFIAWMQYNANSYQLTNLLYLARSLCLTLGFNEPISGPSGSGGCGAGGMANAAAQNLDHIRAFVGCYYQNTVVFTTSKRSDAFMNTTYVETCCTVLAERAEYPSDRLVVSLFRILQLAQSICVTLGADNSLYPSMQVPITAVVQSFQQQLEMYKAALPDELKTNDVIAAHVRVAEVLLYEAAIPEARNSRAPVSPSDRLSLLWACLSAVKGFLEERFRASIFLPPRFTCLSASDWLYVILTGVKLHAIEVPGWEVNMVRSQLPLGDYVDQHLRDLDRYIVARRRGRVGDQLVPYPIVGNNCKAQPPRPVFDVYEQIRHVLSHMKVLGLQELEMLSQLALARQQRQRELQQAQMSPGQQGEQQQQQQQQQVPPLHQQHHQHHQQLQQPGGMGVPGPGPGQGQPLGVDGMAAPAAVMDASQMLRDFDGSFWQEAFDDPAWMLGIDTASMEWTPNY